MITFRWKYVYFPRRRKGKDACRADLHAYNILCRNIFLVIKNRLSCGQYRPCLSSSAPVPYSLFFLHDTRSPTDIDHLWHQHTHRASRAEQGHEERHLLTMSPLKESGRIRLPRFRDREDLFYMDQNIILKLAELILVSYTHLFDPQTIEVRCSPSSTELGAGTLLTLPPAVTLSF